jgi:hypothetical protein
MSNEESKIFAKLFFESLGYSVGPIPQVKEGGQKRADLKATLNDETIVIEAKGKAPNQGYIDLLERVKAQGYGSITREEVAWNAMSSVVEKANRQLEATTAPDNAARILWISCLHDDWKYVLETFRHRLYGDVEVTIFQEINSLPVAIETRSCLYYDYSDFYRYRSIDGAVLACPVGVKVLVNEFGIRVSQFRSTKLYSESKLKGVLYDPESLRESNKVLAIYDLSERNQHTKWQYLLDNYGFKTSVMKSYSYKALMSVQLDTDGKSPFRKTKAG